eukprot:32898_1
MAFENPAEAESSHLDSLNQFYRMVSESFSKFNLADSMDSINVREIKQLLNGVNWREDRWLWGVFGFHAFILLVVLLSRNNTNLLFCVLIMNVALGYFSDGINDWAALHYEDFATQQYFDSHGAFLAVIVYLPLMIISLIAVVTMLIQTASLLMSVKIQRTKRKKIVGQQSTENLNQDQVNEAKEKENPKKNR